MNHLPVRMFLTQCLLVCISSILLLSASAQQSTYRVIAIDSAEAPLIDAKHPGSVGNKQGFEGGVAFKRQRKFHLFVTEEMTGWAQTRTGYWNSADGKLWQRIATMQKPDTGVNDARYSIWSPMPVYNNNEQRWNLFYVGYETKATIHGRVFRAVSEQPGAGGLAGPYKDMNGTVIAYTDSVKNDWEGKQGTDSFFPFWNGKKWLAFYGSSDAASYWHVGLAEADSLEGQWKRLITPPVFSKAENPIVIQLKNGDFLAVYDDLQQLSKDNKIGYAWSKGGLQWQSATFEVKLPAGVENIRTPQSIIPAGKKDTYWIYFTANTTSRFDVVSRVKVKLQKLKE